jgi:hypothetical protein
MKGGFYAQYRGNVLLWSKSDESKKKPGPLLLGYFMVLRIEKLLEKIRAATSVSKTKVGCFILSIYVYIASFPPLLVLFT